MNFNKPITVTLLTFVFSLGVATVAEAAGIGVWCQVRGNERSKVKVTGRGIRGKYFAKIYSGGVWVKSPVKATAYRKIEFEFDSHSEEEPGNTLIPATFIKGRKVLGLIRNAKTKLLVAKLSSECEFRED